MPERPAQQRRRSADLRRDRAERRDPATGVPLVGAQLLRADIRLPPREPALPDEQEWIGEVVQRRAELLDGEDQLLGRHPALAGLDRRNRLAVLEAEQAREVVLRELSLLAQRLDPRSYEIGGHDRLRRMGIILRNANCKIILHSAGRIRPASTHGGSASMTGQAGIHRAPSRRRRLRSSQARLGAGQRRSADPGESDRLGVSSGGMHLDTFRRARYRRRELAIRTSGGP